MSKEKRLTLKAKRLLKQIIKFGAKLDKYDVPFAIKYENATYMIRQKILEDK